MGGRSGNVSCNVLSYLPLSSTPFIFLIAFNPLFGSANSTKAKPLLLPSLSVIIFTLITCPHSEKVSRRTWSFVSKARLPTKTSFFLLEPSLWARPAGVDIWLGGVGWGGGGGDGAAEEEGGSVKRELVFGFGCLWLISNMGIIGSGCLRYAWNS